MPPAGRIVQTKADIAALPDWTFARLDGARAMAAESAQSVHAGYSSNLTGSTCRNQYAGSGTSAR
jgi:hypothetical protein